MHIALCLMVSVFPIEISNKWGLGKVYLYKSAGGGTRTHEGLSREISSRASILSLAPLASLGNPRARD